MFSLALTTASRYPFFKSPFVGWGREADAQRRRYRQKKDGDGFKASGCRLENAGKTSEYLGTLIAVVPLMLR